MTRDGFMNAFQLGRRVPQGLKPAFFQTLNGTAKAVPYPKHETSSNASLIRTRTIRVLAFVLVSSLAGFASVIGTFDRSFQVNGPVDLEVLTRSGDITVRNGAAGTVSIHAKIHADNSWFGGDHKAEAQELQKQSSHSPDRQQHSHRLREYQQHFDRLRNHRPREHRDSRPYRQRRSEGRRPQGQHRSRERIGRLATGAPHR